MRAEVGKPTMKGNAMNETPRQQSEAVKHEIREEHGDAAEATSATPQAQDQVSPGSSRTIQLAIPTTRGSAIIRAKSND